MQKELYDLRKNEHKMSQQDLADYLGISVQAYRDKEKGKRAFTQDEMFAIAELFKRKIDEIFLPRKHQNGNKI
ncbi:helix-turn-helix transcriptional regulator [Enterococcus cecorum]|uniref:helix-turn-helix transcriptional regulator n=1 Tax=Enterococcus cecorum TaxID=44008 RepID=UPI0022D733B8|nr:helix-turn-helix transcriptional regulator [Enterococcus cecorum]CAI3277059.1 helix-turn-helix transcriptional regulator [Enterococcus cecorum]CAI3299487.1 helix-turn-helix transcriptional regulator [Enterococcus cecorum]CAI3309460.1 helix-turn-helix transcriptional regulator [Enterococcus cecorum]CAI3388383.1 helix-turn-helix transcriptional regulator [Enterococcus cecorum]CAI3393992.1 helix-turn-helix transcriptional regulator [Enterococcus cecorum]